MGALGRFLKSRGVRKFRRNRSAMLALGVIGVYTLLTFWVIAIEFVHTRNKSLGLEDHPVFGFLLPEATQAKVGPKEVPGLGLKLAPEKQTQVDRYWYTNLSDAMTKIERASEEERAEVAEVALSEIDAGRPVAEMPLDELTAKYEAFKADFDTYDILLSRQGLLIDARNAAGSVGELKASLDDAESAYGEIKDQLAAFESGDEYTGAVAARDDAADAFDAAQAALDGLGADAGAEARASAQSALDAARTLRDETEQAFDEIDSSEELTSWRQARTDVQNLRETLGFELLKIEDRVRMFVDEVLAMDAESGGLDLIDTAPLFDIGDTLTFAAEEPDTPLNVALEDMGIEGGAVPADLIAQILDGIGKVEPGIQTQIDETRERINPHVREIFPLPTGFEGFMYRLRLLFGTDVQGRSILVRAVYAGKVAMQIGFVTGLIAVIIGSILGAAAAFFGGWVDASVSWLFSTLSSIPSLVLLIVLSFMFRGTEFEGTLITVYIAFCVTFWIGPCRVIRGETMKIKELEYVQAATAIGFGRFYILLKHIIPNTSHLMFINFSLLFIGAVKSEVILSFLGLGLKPGEGASWGVMINQSSKQVVNGFFWQIGAATLFMFILVLAFNILTDALQDAFDPKHVG